MQSPEPRIIEVNEDKNRKSSSSQHRDIANPKIKKALTSSNPKYSLTSNTNCSLLSSPFGRSFVRFPAESCSGSEEEESVWGRVRRRMEEDARERRWDMSCKC